MVVGLSLPFGVGDVVRLAATTNDERQPLVGEQGTVVAVRPGDRLVMATVKFAPADQPDESGREVTLIYGEDELELVRRFTHG